MWKMVRILAGNTNNVHYNFVVAKPLVTYIIIFRFRYLVMGLDLVEFGVCQMLYPLFPHIAGLYTSAFFKGMGAGFLDAGN